LSLKKTRIIINDYLLPIDEGELMNEVQKVKYAKKTIKFTILRKINKLLRINTKRILINRNLSHLTPFLELLWLSMEKKSQVKFYL
jgi:hypothetical protein